MIGLYKPIILIHEDVEENIISMKISVLHIFSSDFISGATIYTIRLAEKQKELGYNINLITDRNTLPTFLTHTALPVSNRSILQRFKNIVYLCRYIKKNQIAIVHAHSRAASWIAYFACQFCDISLVSTIHGRQFKADDKYGEYIIGICENLNEHLKNELQFDPSKIILVPNGIAIPNYTRAKQNEHFTISIIGRFNGPKGINTANLLTQVLPRLLQEYPNLCINMVGDKWQDFPVEGKNCFNLLSSQYKNRIQKFDFISDPFQIMVNSDLVIGAGRVAIEALSLRVPVIAIGEGCYYGLVTRKNIRNAIASNFGDIMPDKTKFRPDCETILVDLKTFIKNSIDIDLSEELTIYNINLVVKNILDIYQQAILKKHKLKHIPVLMYHKVPTKRINSQHKIFVTKERFNRHLRFFSLRGLKSITFKDYNDFITGVKPMNQLPRKPFILTFDDGYEDNYFNMLPLTEKYGFKGVLFLLGDFDILQNFWDKGEEADTGKIMTTVQKMTFVSCGWEIGAHTLTHCHLPEQTDDRIMEELLESRRRLEETLDTKIISFAYPYGSVDDRVKSITSKAGFTYGISTDSGGMTIGDDPLEIFRVNMFPDESVFQLYKKTSSWYRKYYKRKRGK